MKCPFRTITTVDKSSNKTVVTKDFAECLKGACPYFGKKERYYSDATQRMRTVISQTCRGSDNV